MTPIKPDDFAKKNNFGPKGLIPPTMERSLGATIHTDRLIRYFQQARNLIDDSSTFKTTFSEEDCAQLVKDLFGDATTVNIQDALQKLRQNATKPEIKLLIRTLALHSFDPLSPEQTKRVNPLQLWKDLHILDQDILPEARRSGAGKFIVYRLAPNEHGYTRLHIYPPGDGATVEQDYKVHGHFGDASSIVLAGKLVNSHYAVKYSVSPTDTAVYEVTNQTKGNENDKVFTRKSFVFPPELLSTHVYEPGEYYHVPGAVPSNHKKQSPLKHTPEMDLTYHMVGTMDVCATLFTKRRLPENDSELAVISREESGGADKFVRTNAEYKDDKPEDCYALLKEVDKAVRTQLRNVDKVDCSHLSQLSNQAIDASINSLPRP